MNPALDTTGSGRVTAAELRALHEEALVEAWGDAVAREIAGLLPGISFIAFDTGLVVKRARGDALMRAGWAPSEIEGKRPDEVLPAAEAERVLPMYRRALAGDTATYRYTSIGGTVYWVRCAPIHAYGKVIGGVLGIIDKDRFEQIVNSDEGVTTVP